MKIQNEKIIADLQNWQRNFCQVEFSFTTPTIFAANADVSS